MKKIFSIPESEELASKITNKLGEIKFDKFSDGEIKVEFLESVREQRVVIIGSLSTSDSIIQMCMAADAARRGAAKKIIALIPYLSYMRQDRKDAPRSSIGAKVIANMLEACGFDQIITIDLHATQIEGFFNIPVTHIHGYSIFKRFLIENIKNLEEEYMVVSPDVGGAKRAKKLASKLNLPLAIINKEREIANEVSSMALMGDVKGKKIILVDDMIDTGGSLVKATDLLLENGAVEVCACITHGVLSGDAYLKIEKSQIKKLYITDSIELELTKQCYDDTKLNENAAYYGIPEQIEIVSCAPILSRVLKTIKQKKSINTILN